MFKKKVILFSPFSKEKKWKCQILRSVLRLCLIQRQRQEIKYVGKSLAIKNSHFLMVSKSLKLNSPLCTALLSLFNTLLLKVYFSGLIFSKNVTSNFFPKIKLYVDCNLASYYPGLIFKDFIVHMNQICQRKK